MRKRLIVEAHLRALEVLEKHDILTRPPEYSDIKKILLMEEIIINTYPFKGRLKERYIRTIDGICLITIKNNLSIPESKHLIAHALGHHYLHQNNHAYFDSVTMCKKEYQAEIFAATFLLPPLFLDKTLLSATSLSLDCHVPLGLAKRRIKIYKKLGI